KLATIHFYIAVYLVFGEPTQGKKLTAQPIEFKRDLANNLEVSLRLRNIQSKDGNSSLSWLKAGIAVVNKYNALCDKLSVPKRKFKFGAETTRDFTPFDLSHLSVANISNPQVQFVQIAGTANAPTIRFTCTSSADQSFSFDLKYDDGVNNP